MSKKYRNKLCVYCGNKPSATGDHVWAREFCLVKYRNNLPQVPTCEDCNNEKSRLEHYLTTVLPFGGRHRDAAATLETMVPKRLARNQKLAKVLETGYTGEKIPLEIGRIESLFQFITKGFLWHHFGVVLTVDDRIGVTVIRSDGQAFLDCIFSRMRPRDRVDGNLGEGTLLYEGLQATDYSQFTMWRFSVYAGLYFCEESKDSEGKQSVIFAVTGPREPLSKLWRSIFKEELPAA